MGVVYKARQLALGRLVALKMVLDGGALGREEASRLRIRGGRPRAARLQHPNIVRLYETGRCGGCSYLALEYVEGIDLAGLLRRYAPARLRFAAELVETLARAIDHATARGSCTAT